LNERQFDEIQKVRKDIYELRDYLREQELAHSVAHATYAINGKLKVSHLEKLILLFDIFEGINGGRNEISNVAWLKMVTNITPDHIEEFYSKYRIEPFSQTSWLKGFTGGSDDHAGLFIGHTCTVTDALNIFALLESIRSRKIFPEGRHNDYQSLAFTIYKIAYDFSKKKRKKGNKIYERVFDLVDTIHEYDTAPFIDSFPLPGYERYVLKIPSPLKSLKAISLCDPDEIRVPTMCQPESTLTFCVSGGTIRRK
jgi:hypothetical protein